MCAWDSLPKRSPAWRRRRRWITTATSIISCTWRIESSARPNSRRRLWRALRIFAEALLNMTRLLSWDLRKWNPSRRDHDLEIAGSLSWKSAPFFGNVPARRSIEPDQHFVPYFSGKGKIESINIVDRLDREDDGRVVGIEPGKGAVNDVGTFRHFRTGDSLHFVAKHIDSINRLAGSTQILEVDRLSIARP